MMLSYFSTDGKPALLKMASAVPYHKVKIDASYGGNIQYNNLQFINFKQNSTWCGASQRLIRLNEDGADYMPRANFNNPKFINVDFDTFAYLFTPPSAWANLDDCADFPCTAPNNVEINM